MSKPLPSMIFKLIVLVVALAIFCAIAYIPWYYWESAAKYASYRERESLGWAMGLSMIVWLPLSIMLAAAIAGGFLALLWPRRKVTIGERAAQKAPHEREQA